MNLFPLEESIDEAIKFIQKHEPFEGYFVGFSGGKDSIVVLDLVKKAKVKYEAYYTNTTIDPPEIIQFIKKEYPEVKILRPKITFWVGIMKNGLPFINRRWCCRELKENPSLSIPLKHRIFGLRREESWRRRQQPQVAFIQRQKTWAYKPIFEWSSREIWEYIRQEKLLYCSLYDEGYARIGCIPCFFCSKSQWEKDKQRWPRYFELLEKYKVKYWKEHQHQYLRMTFEDYMKWPFWEFDKNKKKEENLDLFKEDAKISLDKNQEI